jgi:phosphatidylserine/phosphatidylglycerophosphate/cardiolipin synthase-like enzyme
VRLDDWFLDASERGNPSTAIDHGREPAAWTEGNQVDVLVDGHEYFSRLHEALCTTQEGDWVYVTDLDDDGDELLRGPGTEVADLLAGLARRGVRVRGLVWRAHVVGAGENETDNARFSRAVNDAGGAVLLDNRIRRGGSHHQKIVVIRRPHAAARSQRPEVAFLGGIDLAHGRGDDHRHLGDPQAVDLGDARYGERPPWHDVQVRLVGPAVGDVALTFAERWYDPAPLDTPRPWRAVLHRAAKQPNTPPELEPGDIDPTPRGTVAVQILRTYPARRVPYPFAVDGERSVARAYLKAFGRARRFVYVEDQYLWSLDATGALCAALAREPELRVVVLLPRYPDPAGKIVGNANHFGRERVLDRLRAAGGGRVAAYDLENVDGTPVYVHSKTCIVDDIWTAVGSDNLNRRSWTHDSEISCAMIDTTMDEREPRDPAGRGDGARRLARDTRLRLTCEHLERDDDDRSDLVDPVSWFDALAASARVLDEWHGGGRRGLRPRGHLRPHRGERVGALSKPLLHAVHAAVLDPDGRPRRMRRRDEL